MAAYAQQSATSNTVLTQFGNAPYDQKPNINTTGALPPLEWDQKIVDSLGKGSNGLYSKLPINITNGAHSTGVWLGSDSSTIYWCTFSIVDSYNLASISGLSKNLHAAVVTMRQFWKGSQAASLGYKYLDYQSNNDLLRLAQPGYAIFMESASGVHTGFEHAAMLKVISIDVRGNGFVDTNDSNSHLKTNHYPVVEWSIKNTPYAVRGLGGI